MCHGHCIGSLFPITTYLNFNLNSNFNHEIESSNTNHRGTFNKNKDMEYQWTAMNNQQH